MRCFRKILGITFFLGFILSLAPLTHAQSALDEIKAKLEGEGISLLDYSTPEGEWGSLPREWIELLAPTYDNLGELANDFKNDFIGPNSLSDLRRQLAILVGEKSRITLQSDIDSKQDEIEAMEENIQDLEEDIKSNIGDLIGQPSSLDKEAGVNLIFEEIDFYFNFNKWGRLPARIIVILEEAGYKNLQDLVDVEGESNIQTALSNIEGLSADDEMLIKNSIAILSATGERQVNEVARTIANTIKNIVFGLAIIWILVAGMRMVFAQGEESIITEQKRAILYIMLGLVVILMVDRGIDFLYGPAGINRTVLTPDEGFSMEIYGVINFIRTLIGIVAVMFIIISGVRMIFAVGAEDEITKQKTALTWIAVGLVLMAVNRVIINNFFIIPTQQSDQISTSNVTTVINTVGRVFEFGLGFVGLIAFGAIVYAAANMIINYSNEELVEKSKKILKHAIIGIMVILSAYVIVATMVVFK